MKFLLVVATLVSMQTAFAEPPSIQMELQKPGDAAEIQQEAGRTVIVVTSQTGIGQLKLSSKEGRWSKEVTLRLRYKDAHAFTTLEGFEMTSSRWQVRSSSGQSGKVPFFLADDDGKFSRNDLNPSGWLKLDFKRHGDELDVIFPAHLWRDEKEVRIQWIDYYRM